MKKIVVTGALGHIGSKLIREIPKKFPGCEILLIDNLLTQRYSSLFNLSPETKFSFHEKDILKDDISEHLRSAVALIHLAAITDATTSFERAEEVEQVNFEGTKIIAKLCSQNNVPMIFLSTTSVYGTQMEVVDEDCSPEELKPQSPYAKAKLESEKWLTKFGKDKDFKFITLRFGTIFGTSIGMRFHTAINKFCWQAVNGKPLSVWKSALNQNRPYLDLKDGISALLFVLENKLFDKKIYNIVTTNTSVGNIVELIKSYVPSTQVELVDSKIMNQLSYHVLGDKIKSLGFNVEGSLTEGIKETIELFNGIKRD